jgi:hypothetical protein
LKRIIDAVSNRTHRKALLGEVILRQRDRGVSFLPFNATGSGKQANQRKQARKSVVYRSDGVVICHDDRGRAGSGDGRLVDVRLTAGVTADLLLDSPRRMR